MRASKLASLVTLVTTAGLAVLLAFTPVDASPLDKLDLPQNAIKPRPCCKCGDLTCAIVCCGKVKSPMAALALRAFYGIEIPRGEATEDVSARILDVVGRAAPSVPRALDHASFGSRLSKRGLYELVGINSAPEHATRGSHVLEGVARAVPDRENNAAPLSARNVNNGQVDPRGLGGDDQLSSTVAVKRVKRQAPACVKGCPCGALGLRCAQECCDTTKRALLEPEDGGHALSRAPLLFGTGQPHEESNQGRDIERAHIVPRLFLEEAQLRSGLALKSAKRQAPACVKGCACPPFGFRCAQECCAMTKGALPKGFEGGRAVPRALLLGGEGFEGEPTKRDHFQGEKASTRALLAAAGEVEEH